MAVKDAEDDDILDDADDKKEEEIKVNINQKPTATDFCISEI